MADNFDTNRKSFTFKWILENFDYCWQKRCKFFTSPSFIVDTIERTKWVLEIYPRGAETDDWISISLNREDDCNGPANIEIAFELAILASDGSTLTSMWDYKHDFSKNICRGFLDFVKRELLFNQRSIFLPQGVLTIQCKMWKGVGEVEMVGQCIARNLIVVERNVFVWKIPDFSTIEVGQEIPFELRSSSEEKTIMSLSLFLRGNDKLHMIVIKFTQSDESILFSTFKSSIIDAENDYVDCGEHEFLSSTSNQGEECNLSVSKDDLMESGWLYLPNDVLTLYCDLAFSKGKMMKVIESMSYGCTTKTINVKSTYSDTSSDLETDSGSSLSENTKTASIKSTYSDNYTDLQMDLGSLLQDNIFCDVKLCTTSETFEAHWLILSARSPVFRDMFKSDKTRQEIDMEDLKPETVRRMLLYLYTDILEVLQWESASDMYTAAEKYQITTLKDKCSSFLQANLSLTNACEILLLADLHKDEELKWNTQAFILENDKKIFNSNEWELLMAANLPLAAETMLLRYK